MPAVPAIIMAGAALASAAAASRASGQATRAQERAANEALGFEREQWAAEETRRAPYRRMGELAVGQLTGMNRWADPGAPASPFQPNPVAPPGATNRPLPPLAPPPTAEAPPPSPPRRGRSFMGRMGVLAGIPTSRRPRDLAMTAVTGPRPPW